MTRLRAARHDEDMALQLAPEEPEAGPWRVERLSTVVNAVTRRRPDQGGSGRPAVLAIDGRSNNGKTTLAARIRGLVPGSAVIHTDDIAWAHSRFGWADLLIDGILVPVHHGQAVSYRPPRWDEHGREGSIEVPVGRPVDGAPFDEGGWMAEEIPFNAAQRTWERADIIVRGTPEIPYDPGTEIVIAPPRL